MKRLSVLFCALTLINCSPTDEGFARARQIETLSDAIGGPKALAQPGDYLLENDYLRVAILGPRNSIGPGMFGGSLVDADLQWQDPLTSKWGGRDQFAELFPLVNMNVAHPIEADDVRILKDGSDGGPAIIRVEAAAEPFITLLGALWALVGAPDFVMQTDFEVSPGQSWVTMKTRVAYGQEAGAELTNVEAITYFDEAFPLMEWAIQSGVVIGDFYLSGGHVNVFAPGIGFDEDGAVFEAMEEGLNTFSEPFEFEFIAGMGDGISYGIAPREGAAFVPLFTASQTAIVGGAADGDGSAGRFADGTTFEYERYFFIGHGDIGSVVDSYIEAKQIPYGVVSGHVLERHTGDAVTGIDVFVFPKGENRPWSHWRTDVNPEDTTLDGSFGGRLPVGDWDLKVHARGRPHAKTLSVKVREGEEQQVLLEAPRVGVLTFEIEDETGNPVPSKLSIFRTDDAPTRDPVLGDSFIAGSPESVVFAAYGGGEVELAPGTYYAVASRGIEYEIDISEPFSIDRSNAHHLQLQVTRSVESDGWITADFHVHAAPSHDSGVSLADRVRTMVCEGVEFFSSTDHDYLTDYAPTVELLGMEEWVQTAVGLETTTVEIGHFLSFPLETDFLAEAGGAFDWTDMTPGDILEEIDEQGSAAGYEPMKFVGHPRDGILGYFDQYGFSPYSGIPGSNGNPGQPTIETPLLAMVNPLLAADNMSWDFHALELLNSKRLEKLRTPTQGELDGFAAGQDISVYDMMERTLEEQDMLESGVFNLGYGYNGQLDDWFALLNLGFKYTLLGNSDTHGLTSTEAGCPRNFVMSFTDDPAYIDDQAIADAVKEHRVVASYGPFVRFWVDDHSIGDEFQPEDDEVDISIEVQAPSWIDVDRLELYQNGTLIQEWALEDSFGPTQLIETTVATVEQDAWFVVVAMGDGDLSPVFTPVEVPYLELQVIITEALAGLESVSSLLAPAVPIPRVYPVHPYAVANPIWVDREGNGFDAPGIASWVRPPVTPE